MSQAIRSAVDHKKFMASKTKAALLAFVIRLNRSCIGQRAAREMSEVLQKLLSLFERIQLKVDDFPASHRSDRRFGDPAFRHFHQWLNNEAPRLIHGVAAESALSHAVVDELAVYLASCFGDFQRLDYGTGHETAQLIFLLCLHRLGIISDADIDSGALVLTVFKAYVVCCRRIQTEYLLEPAGSRGVWALDDYQCLPFLFGSAQHIGSTLSARYTNGNDLSNDLVRAHEHYSLFFQCIAYIQQAKTQKAPFAETSPVLFAYATKSWSAINRAILKYYDTEVLGTFVVARHLRFGNLFPASWLPPHVRRPRLQPHAESIPQKQEDASFSEETNQR